MRYDCAFGAMNRLGPARVVLTLSPARSVSATWDKTCFLAQSISASGIVESNKQCRCCLKPLCAATERFFHCSAEDDRDFRKTLGNADAHHVIPSFGLLKI